MSHLDDVPSRDGSAPRSNAADGAGEDTWDSFDVRASDLAVVFQPIVRCNSLEVFAYEALARCSLPHLRDPEVLFAHAARHGRCGELGRFIREIAVPHCAGRPLFLNVHPHELTQGWLVRPDDPIYSHDCDIYLEIVESMPFDDFDLSWRVLRDVQSHGNVLLVIDDLGVGFSNLGRISKLSPRIVKLDRQLIAGMTIGSRQHLLVAGVVELCRDLGAMVVAEGVETVEEFDAVRTAGAQYAQGYLFARPAFPAPPVGPRKWFVSGRIEQVAECVALPRAVSRTSHAGGAS